MAIRRTSGSVVCPSCGSLVGVNDDKCYSCGRANPGLWGFGPLLRQLGADFSFTPLVISLSIAMYALTLLATARVFGPGALRTLSPNGQILAVFGSSGSGAVFRAGEWTTLLTASWLHAGVLHVVFNMMAVRNLTPATIDLIGPGRTISVYLLSGVAGFLLTSAVSAYFPYIPFLTGAGQTVGASASVCGLIGAIAHYGRRSGSSLIRAQTSQWAFGLVIMGVLMPGVDNVAHLGGFLGGYGLSAAFNPLTGERGDHMLIAFACLGVTLLALAYHVWRAIAFIFF